MRRTYWAGLGACVVGAASMAWAEPPPDRGVSWLRPPSKQDLLSVWPEAALRRGKGGKVKLQCQVSVQGALYECAVASETPAGLGFGAAAVSLTPQLLMRPATRNGAPVASAVTFEVAFQAPELPTGTHIPGGGAAEYADLDKIRTNVAWLAAPAYDDVVAAYPAKAEGKAAGGGASLNCRFGFDGRLKACRILSEEPRGLGFGQAALALSHRFQAPLTDAKGDRLADDYTQFAVVFAPEMLTSEHKVVGKPSWTALPTAADFHAQYPTAARSAGVGRASILMRCQVGPTGTLDGCQVERETPEGLGFGDAALGLTPRFRLALWTAEGLPVIGGSVLVPLRYDVTLVEASPPAKP